MQESFRFLLQARGCQGLVHVMLLVECTRLPAISGRGKIKRLHRWCDRPCDRERVQDTTHEGSLEDGSSSGMTLSAPLTNESPRSTATGVATVDDTIDQAVAFCPDPSSNGRGYITARQLEEVRRRLCARTVRHSLERKI
jgi:hypothetical protein